MRRCIVRARRGLPSCSAASRRHICWLKRRDPGCKTRPWFRPAALPETRRRWLSDGPAFPTSSSPTKARSSCSTRISIAAAIFPPLGFKAADVTRANVILIGHGHFDHMSDAASVAIRTGAVVVGAPLTTEKLLTQKVDPKQVRTVTGKGGEELKFQSFTVEPILGRHGEPPPDVTAPFNQALQRTTPRPTPEQSAEQAAIREPRRRRPARHRRRHHRLPDHAR